MMKNSLKHLSILVIFLLPLLAAGCFDDKPAKQKPDPTPVLQSGHDMLVKAIDFLTKTPVQVPVAVNLLSEVVKDFDKGTDQVQALHDANTAEVRDLKDKLAAATGAQGATRALYLSIPIAVVLATAGSVLVYLTFTKLGIGLIIGGAIQGGVALLTIKAIEYADIIAIPVAIALGVFAVGAISYAAYWVVKTIQVRTMQANAAHGAVSVGVRLTHPIVAKISNRILERAQTAQKKAAHHVDA